MLDAASPMKFTPLPHEQILYTSPPRTSLTLSSLNPFPGAQPFSLGPTTGTFYLTNQRILFLPTSTTTNLPQQQEASQQHSDSSSVFQSFAAPLPNLENSRLSIPWMGPNIWTVLVTPVAEGGLHTTGHERLELKITFKDGGAADFQPRYERIRERVLQAADVARESGVMGAAAGSVVAQQAHLEELPAYPGPPVTGGVGPPVAEHGQAMPGVAPAQEDLPPCYEDVQREIINDDLGNVLMNTQMGNKR